jgi:uncharacterized protein YPO0396
MKEKLAIIGGIIALLVFLWGVATYLEKYETCADAQQKQQMNEYKFKSIDLRTLNQQIYDLEKSFGVKPNNTEKAAELEKLKREREDTKYEMEGLKKK